VQVQYSNPLVSKMRCYNGRKGSLSLLDVHAVWSVV